MPETDSKEVDFQRKLVTNNASLGPLQGFWSVGLVEVLNNFIGLQHGRSCCVSVSFFVFSFACAWWIESGAHKKRTVVWVHEERDLDQSHRLAPPREHVSKLFDEFFSLGTSHRDIDHLVAELQRAECLANDLYVRRCLRCAQRRVRAGPQRSMRFRPVSHAMDWTGLDWTGLT